MGGGRKRADDLPDVCGGRLATLGERARARGRDDHLQLPPASLGQAEDGDAFAMQTPTLAGRARHPINSPPRRERAAKHPHLSCIATGDGQWVEGAV